MYKTLNHNKNKNALDTNTKEKKKHNVLLTLSYDGTDFAGWQKQLKHGEETFRTVQGEVEKALEVIHKSKTEIVGSGRTDSGVHAQGQIANFYSPYPNMKAENYILALNSILPKDIRILQAKTVPEDFHARFSTKARTYRYFCTCSESIYPWETRYTYHIRRYPNLEALNEMASFLQGELDFTTFASAKDSSKSRHRYIEKAHFFMQGERLVFEITANAFLWRMVRSITGTLLDLERKKASAITFNNILTSLNRSLAGPTAPPEGLFLWEIRY